MAMVFGKEIMVILILDNGIKIRLMVMVFMSGQTGTDMRVNGSLH